MEAGCPKVVRASERGKKGMLTMFRNIVYWLKRLWNRILGRRCFDCEYWHQSTAIMRGFGGMCSVDGDGFHRCKHPMCRACEHFIPKPPEPYYEESLIVI